MPVVLWLAMAVLAFVFGAERGRPVLGAVLGLLLGVFGVMVMAMLPPKRHAR